MVLFPILNLSYNIKGDFIIKSKNELKEHIDALFNFASKVNYSSNHIIPILQACKALIGMDITNPFSNILKWIEHCMHEYKPNSYKNIVADESEKEIIVTTYRLEQLIKEKNINKSKLYLSNMLRLGDPKHIMEILFELSFNYGIRYSIFCWYIYKTIKNVDEKISIELLFIALESLFDDSLKASSSKDNFIFLCHSQQILNANMVRNKNIYKKVNSYLDRIYEKNNYKCILSDELLLLIEQGGIVGLKKYIRSLSIKDLSVEKIFLFDAIRSLLTYHKDKMYIDKLLKSKK